jgi:hypothetical protein
LQPQAVASCGEGLPLRRNPTLLPQAVAEAGRPPQRHSLFWKSFAKGQENVRLA